MTIAQVALDGDLDARALQAAFSRLNSSVRKRGAEFRIKPKIKDAINDEEILKLKQKWDSIETAIKGSVSEGYVKNKLLELGFDVWEPASQNHKTDFLIVDGDHAIRIQVKTATYDAERKRFRCNFHRRGRSASGKVLYDEKDVDFFISFCPGLPALEFYVIPSVVVGSTPCVNFLPHRERETNFSAFSWETYRNAFHLLRSDNETTESVRLVLRGRRRGQRV